MSTSAEGPQRLFESLGNVRENVQIVFVTDRRGDVWRIVRDGAMAARITLDGEVESAGIRWLARSLGPLVAFDPIAYRKDDPSVANAGLQQEEDHG